MLLSARGHQICRVETMWNLCIVIFFAFFYTFTFPPSLANTTNSSSPYRNYSNENIVVTSHTNNITHINNITGTNFRPEEVLRRIDPSDPEEMDILMKRPRKDKYRPGFKRILKPVQIVPNETPCTQATFLEFFQECQMSNLSAVEVLGSTTVKYHDDEEFFYYDPEDVCIEVDANQVVDIYKYDCSTKGVCTCGFHMSSVDPNVPTLVLEDGVKEYYLVNGLNRKLMVENGICVSGVEGHCSLYNSTLKEKLTCQSRLDCVLDDSFGQILKNRLTQELYGVCLPSQDKAAVVYDRINRACIIHLDYQGVMMTLIITMLFHIFSFSDFIFCE